MKITTTPVCRVGWEGQTLSYIVRAEGATELAVGEHEIQGVTARITDVRHVDGGVEGELVVEIVDSTLY